MEVAVEIPQLQVVEKIGGIPETVEISQLQLVGKIDEIPDVLTVQGVPVNSRVEYVVPALLDDLFTKSSEVAVTFYSDEEMGTLTDEHKTVANLGLEISSKRQRHSSQHQSVKQFARQAARKNTIEEERGEEGEKGEVRRKEERKSQGEGVQRGNGKEQEREKKEKGDKEEDEKVEQVDEDVMGWTVVTRSRKQRNRTVQIFVKVDGMKTVLREVSPEYKVQDILNDVRGKDAEER